jgi:hypothetical protein
MTTSQLVWYESAYCVAVYVAVIITGLHKKGQHYQKE